MNNPARIYDISPAIARRREQDRVDNMIRAAVERERVRLRWRRRAVIAGLIAMWIAVASILLALAVL